MGHLGSQLELDVCAADESGEPADRAVAFQLIEGDASVGETVTTDAPGCTRCTVTLGEPGGVVVEARSGKAWPVRLHLWSYPEPKKEEKPLCVLTFNDFHMHFEPWGPPWRSLGGLARLASLLKSMREANRVAGIPTIVLNAGDDLENTLYSDEPGAFEALLTTWDRVGVDFWQVGNHDFHFGIPFLADRIQSVRGAFADYAKGHPMVITWGNADPATLFEDVAGYAERFETGFSDLLDERMFQQTSVLDVGGLKVGVFGVVTDAAVYTQVPGNPLFLQLVGAPSPDAQGLTFRDPDPRGSDYVGDAIDVLDGQGADIILANSHAGLGFGDRVNIPPGKDEHIARHGVGHQSGRPVDLIVSGHSHVKLNRAIYLDNPSGGRTGIVQAVEGGLFVSRSDLVVDRADGSVRWIDSRLIQVDETAGDDPETASMVLEFSAFLDQRFPGRHGVVAQVDGYLSSRERSFSSMGRLINTAFLNSLPQDGITSVSFVVPSTYRTDIHPGPVDLDLTYQVLSMHKMDATGANNDTITYITLRPGRFDLSLMGIAQTRLENVTVIEYMVELVHSLQDVLGDIMPAGASELNLDVVQLGRVSYVLDSTAPPFHRVVPGSLRVDGKPPDPTQSYRIAGAHSIVRTFASVVGSFILAQDPDTGVDAGSVAVPDGDTGELFTDTGVELWRSLHRFLDEGLETVSVPDDLLLVDGAVFRTLQPDLTVNPSDIRLDPTRATPGDEVRIAVRVRNLGETPVSSATVTLFYESTPWDQADDPDGFEHLQDLPVAHKGSRVQIDEKNTAVGAWPGSTDLEFMWTIPAGLPSGPYPIEVRLSKVIGDGLDPNTAVPYAEYTTTNNDGMQRSRYLIVE